MYLTKTMGYIGQKLWEILGINNGIDWAKLWDMLWDIFCHRLWDILGKTMGYIE